MSKLPEGRKPLPNEWFIDRANMLSREKIRPLSDQERKRALERYKANKSGNNEDEDSNS